MNEGLEGLRPQTVRANVSDDDLSRGRNRETPRCCQDIKSELG
jgi:hypothetical protein